MKYSLTVNVVELHAVTLAHGETTTHCMYAEFTQAHVSVPRVLLFWLTLISYSCRFFKSCIAVSVHLAAFCSSIRPPAHETTLFCIDSLR